MHWFVCHTQAQKEPLAARELRRANFEVFWPYTTEWVSAGHKAKSRLVKRSWLSRYLFVKTLKEHLWAVNGFPGVSSVVFAPGGEPYPVPDQFMERELLSQADHRGEMHVRPKDSPRSWLKEGDLVRMSEASPFFNFWVEVIKVLDKDRAIAIFNEPLFGADGRKVEIRADDVAERHDKREEAGATAKTV